MQESRLSFFQRCSNNNCLHLVSRTYRKLFCIKSNLLKSLGYWILICKTHILFFIQAVLSIPSYFCLANVLYICYYCTVFYCLLGIVSTFCSISYYMKANKTFFTVAAVKLEALHIQRQLYT